MYGVTQTTYRSAGYAGSVRSITKTQAEDIYWTRYWLAAGCDNLALAFPAMALVHFDAAVNHGVGNAKKLLSRAGGTAQGYIAARRRFYAAIIAADPPMADNRNGWENRMRRLERRIATMQGVA